MATNNPTILCKAPRSHTDHLQIEVDGKGVKLTYGNWVRALGFQPMYWEYASFEDNPELEGIYQNGRFQLDEVWMLVAAAELPPSAYNPMRLLKKSPTGDWVEIRHFYPAEAV